MIIYSENGYYPHSHFKLYKKKRSRMTTEYFHDLNNVLVDHPHDTESDHIFLLNEKRFRFFKFNIFEQVEKKFSIHDLNRIIEDKLISIYGETQGYRVLFYTTDTIFVNGEPSKYLLAKQGDIFFRLSLIFVDHHTTELFSRRRGNIFDLPNVSVYPRSYFTSGFLKKKLHKENFHLLNIQDESSMCLSLKDGFYEHIAMVNWGSSMLRGIYKDNGISELFCKTKEEIGSNPIALQAIKNSVNFFTKMLAKRLSEHIEIGTDIILISDLSDNEFFQEALSKRYTEYLSGNIIPFHHSTMLETHGRNWKADDIYALTAIDEKFSE